MNLKLANSLAIVVALLASGPAIAAGLDDVAPISRGTGVAVVIGVAVAVLIAALILGRNARRSAPSREVAEAMAAADRQQRLLDLQRLSTRILEGFLHSDDLGTTVSSMLGMIGEACKLSRASLVRIESTTSVASVISEWCAPGVPSALERRKEQPTAKTAWWIATARAGQPSTFQRDRRGDDRSSSEVSESVHQEVLAILVVPILAHGLLHAAIVLEDLLTPRQFLPEEISTAQTLVFAIARGMEQIETSEERSRLNLLQRQLERSEVVAQLAGGVAHDFNNLLFAVGGQVQLLRQRVTDIETQAALDGIERAFGGATSMVAGMLRAHRGEIDSPRLRTLRTDLEGAVRLVGRLLPRTIELDVDFAQLADARVMSSEEGLRQLILNLVLNARDALARETGMERGQIRIAGQIVDDPVLGPCGQVTVEDDGPGIAPEMRERVLAPFFTTKGVSGTGLGLSICQRVVNDAGGRFTLDSSHALGGLRVIARLPLSEALDIRSEIEGTDLDSPFDVPHQFDTVSLDDVGIVLLVEDDPAVRRLLVQALTAHDVEVLERPDTRDVDNVIFGSPLRIDLIVMDVDLPGMSGMECVRRLRASGSTIPVLFVTGGTTELDPSVAPAVLLRKPFPIEQLAVSARELLDSVGATRS